MQSSRHKKHGTSERFLLSKYSVANSELHKIIETKDKIIESHINTIKMLVNERVNIYREHDKEKKELREEKEELEKALYQYIKESDEVYEELKDRYIEYVTNIELDKHLINDLKNIILDYLEI